MPRRSGLCFCTERNTHTSLGDAVVNGVSFHGFEAGAGDHFDDLLLGHFDFVIGLNGVAVGEFAAIGEG